MCLRCQKAKFECKGYNLILGWADGLSIDKKNEMVSIPISRSSSEDTKDGGWMRRNVELVRFPKLMQFETYAKLNDVINDLDDVSESSANESHFSGPFGFYRPQIVVSEGLRQSKLLDAPLCDPQTQRSARSTTRSKSLSETEALPSKSNPIRDTSYPVEKFGSIFSKADNEFVHYKLLHYAKLTIVAIKGNHYKFNEQSMFHILYPKFFVNTDSDDWVPSVKVLNHFFNYSNKQVIISPAIRESMTYLTSSNICFIRVASPNLYWDTLVVTFLKQNLFELVCEEYSITGNWDSHLVGPSEGPISRKQLIKNIRFGVLCMTLALCHFHKYLKQGKKYSNAVDEFYIDEDLMISISLRKFGIIILNRHMDEYGDYSLNPDNDCYDTYILLAIVLQIHLDNSFGVFENYELIFAIGDYILKGKNGTETCRRFSPIEKYLRNFFGVLCIFYESTQAINLFNYSISEKDQLLNYLDLNENYDLTKGMSHDDPGEASDESDDDLAESAELSSNIKVAPLNNDQLTFTVHFNESGLQAKTKNGDDTRSIQDLKLRKTLSVNSMQAHPKTPKIGDKSIYLSFGLPKSLVELFRDIIQLTNHKNVFQTKGVTPRNFSKICAEVEDKLVNWNVENYWKLYDNEYNPISNVATKTFISRFHEKLYYNVTSFHSALLVYFKRLIPAVPIETYQNDIQMCFDALEKLVRMYEEAESGENDALVTPSFWPLLVCGSDIDLRTHASLKEQCQELWKGKCFKKYNYWRSKQILFEVWKRRAGDGENTGFMDMIREWGIIVCLG